MKSVPFTLTATDQIMQVQCGERSRDYSLPGTEQQDWLDFHAAVAADFGTRLPRNRDAAAPSAYEFPYRPLLTSAASPTILYGYGDPAVIRADGRYYLYVTSNDAADIFPILRSNDLEKWEHVGHTFLPGGGPAWAAEGMNVADYWAPEVQFVGGRFLLCFAAREKDRSLSIGLATASSPEGPFTLEPEPLLRGGVIDAHIFADSEGSPFLFWKEDSNAVWPRLLADLLHSQPSLIDQVFDRTEDRTTAALAAALWPYISDREPMEQFFALQPLIETAVENYSALKDRLDGLGLTEATDAMRTRIFAQRLSGDGLRLIGERTEVLCNDLEWEGHLIEGPWLTERHGLYYLFYAGNDFSTSDYGIGVAIAASPLGPFCKVEEPLLRSTDKWWGPGHPSVAPGPDGQPQIFFHAFSPGQVGYKAFRALLTAKLRFYEDRVELSR